MRFLEQLSTALPDRLRFGDPERLLAGEPDRLRAGEPDRLRAGDPDPLLDPEPDLEPDAERDLDSAGLRVGVGLRLPEPDLEATELLEGDGDPKKNHVLDSFVTEITIFSYHFVIRRQTC